MMPRYEHRFRRLVWTKWAEWNNKLVRGGERRAMLKHETVADLICDRIEMMDALEALEGRAVRRGRRKNQNQNFY